jgi:phospholipid/cholesterol/gamma-HCH transport system substrate-binding protein
MASRSKTVKVGIFLFVGIAAVVALTLALSGARGLFSSTVRLHASFLNISGLVVGTPVRLAGVDVGIVDEIAFDPDLQVKAVHVVMSVEKRFLERIRQDSLARLGSKGLLGDMIVNITVGSPGSPAIEPEGTLKTKETESLTEIMQSLQDAIGNVKNASGALGEAIQGVLTEEVRADVGRIIHGAANVMERVEKGPGLAHTVLYDPSLAQHAGGLVASAERVSGRAEHAVASVDEILSQTDVTGALKNIERAAGELAQITSAVRTGKGLAHNLIFEEDRSRLNENLTAVSQSLRTAADDLDKGRGTLGALLKDPTIYQDLKIILGNVKRSRMLRSLVRFTIAADDLEAPPLPTSDKDK